MGFYAASDCELGLTLSHGGGYPGYGSHVLLLPDYGLGIFAFANRTYAGPRAPVWDAAVTLLRAGRLKPRSPQPSSALAGAYSAATKMFLSGSVMAAGDVLAMTGFSYDNTVDLGATTWRHVAFVERPSPAGVAWLMLSDVCKHCVQAGCLEVCPTGAIIRTEFDTVVIQADVCNGCRDCIAACPFGVIEINPVSKTAQKCTLCYDRLQVGMTPACAQACPTASIQFGQEALDGVNTNSTRWATHQVATSC